MKKIKLKKLFLINIIFIQIFFINNCFLKEILYYTAPVNLENTTRDMKLAEFWISRHEYPHKIILNKAEINEFNKKIYENPGIYVDNIAEFDEYIKGTGIKYTINSFYTTIKNTRRYKKDGKPADKKFYEIIENNLNLENITADINTQYGFIFRQADQKIIPYDQTLHTEKYDIEFDDLQTSLLDIGTEIAILHESRDKKWYFVKSPLTYGWIESGKIAICKKQQLKDYLYSPDFVIITSPKAAIFLDKKLTSYYSYARMGVKFKYSRDINNDLREIYLPYKDNYDNFIEIKAYVKTEDCNQGYLPYTPAVIIRQAFKLLNTPYGWGGSFGEQDCSRMMCEIFAATGIILPRNSSMQSKTGIPAGDITSIKNIQDKNNFIIANAIPGITLLRMPGHIMLYIGNYNGNPYVIHDSWGYRQKLLNREIIRVTNKVVVTDLSPGYDSSKGSFLQRIRNINIVK